MDKERLAQLNERLRGWRTLGERMSNGDTLCTGCWDRSNHDTDTDNDIPSGEPIFYSTPNPEYGDCDAYCLSCVTDDAEVWDIIPVGEFSVEEGPGHTSVAPGDVVERVWSALKEKCCADPAKAKQCVMVSKADVRDALSASKVQGLVDALDWYAQQFCELGQYHECCGRMTGDQCSGCLARKAVASFKEGRS